MNKEDYKIIEYYERQLDKLTNEIENLIVIINNQERRIMKVNKENENYKNKIEVYEELYRMRVSKYNKLKNEERRDNCKNG